MRKRTVLEGNAFYEIDEDCMEQKRRRSEAKKAQDALRDRNSQRPERGTRSDKMR